MGDDGVVDLDCYFVVIVLDVDLVEWVVWVVGDWFGFFELVECGVGEDDEFGEVGVGWYECGLDGGVGCGLDVVCCFGGGVDGEWYVWEDWFVVGWCGWVVVCGWY